MCRTVQRFLQDELAGRRHRADEAVPSIFDMLFDLVAGGFAVAALDGGENRSMLDIGNGQSAAEFEAITAVDAELLAHLRIKRSKLRIAGGTVEGGMERDVEADIAVSVGRARRVVHGSDQI